MGDPKVQLKLFIDTKADKLLFAEAGKDFVDFIFYLRTLPVNTVVRLLDKKSEVGCLDDIYTAIEDLSDMYMQTGHKNKHCLLNPRGRISINEIPCLLPDLKVPKAYWCLCCYYVTYDPSRSCSTCKGTLYELKNVASSVAAHKTNDGQGYVKLMNYVVMDNLDVKPMTTITVFNLLKKVGELEERVVELGLNKGLKLLKASLECKTVLTSVFLGNKEAKMVKDEDSLRGI